jgi:hypothetical protein
MESDKTGKWFLYDTANGAILGKTMGLESNLLPLEPGQAYLEIDGSHECCYGCKIDITANPPRPVMREPLAINVHNTTAPADGTTPILITNVPDGCHVTCDLPAGQSNGFVNDGIVSVTSKLKGTGKIAFTPVTCLATTIEVTFV